MQVSKAIQPVGKIVVPGLHPLHQIFTLFAPVCFLALLVTLKLFATDTYMTLVQEDGIFEYLTFIVYAIGTGFALAISSALWRRGERLFGALYLLLALGLFVIGGEEISWGQRIFQIQSPELFQAINNQQETNVHNMLSRRKLHALYIIFSSALAFAWLFLPWVIRRLPTRLSAFFGERTWLMAPDRRLMLFFLPCTLLYIYLERDILKRDDVQAAIGSLFGAGLQIRNPLIHFIYHRDQEPIELLLGAGLMLFVIVVFWRMRQPSKPTA